MENRIFNYNGNNITFNMNSDENVMINATEMAKPFNKAVAKFLGLDNTKEYIKAYCQDANMHLENEFSPNGKLIKVVHGGRNNGTWMERSVALKFAAWLNPFFEVWVYKMIDQILFGEFVALKNKLKEAASRKARIETIRKELENDPSTDQRIKELFLLEETEKKEAKQRYVSMGKQIKDYKQMIIRFQENTSME